MTTITPLAPVLPVQAGMTAAPARETAETGNVLATLDRLGVALPPQAPDESVPTRMKKAWQAYTDWQLQHGNTPDVLGMSQTDLSRLADVAQTPGAISEAGYDTLKQQLARAPQPVGTLRDTLPWKPRKDTDTPSAAARDGRQQAADIQAFKRWKSGHAAADAQADVRTPEETASIYRRLQTLGVPLTPAEDGQGGLAQAWQDYSRWRARTGDAHPVDAFV